MKYSEFEREVEKLGCEVYDRGYDLSVKRNTHIILIVNKNREFEFDNEWHKWSGIGEIKCPLFDLAYQLAKTPIVEREEEKKYHLKLELPIPLEDSSMHWLNQKVGASKYHFGSQENIRDYKTIFTESEVAQMDLTGLKLIEVKDE